jgi:transposase
MLDYKSIITKRYALKMSYQDLADEFSASKSGINDFIRAFEKCEKLSYPLPEGITNYAIYELVYGHAPGTNNRSTDYEQPDFAYVFKQMDERKNMTLVYLWGRYQKNCTAKETRPYQYRQFCELYSRWCEENYETLHIQAVIGQKMEVDFAGKTFDLIDKLTGEITRIVVFVAVLPYSQFVYAEGMTSTCEPQWIEVNNHALDYFRGVPPIVVCDNCKQAVIANKDWIDPDLNQDYAAWADHNHTVILPAKVRRPKWKSSVENAVGILEKGFFHDLEENRYFSLEQFNRDLWLKLDALNHDNFKKRITADTISGWKNAPN